MKKKALVSACILGEYCRYDGKTKKINAVIEALGDEYEIIPFCPEAPLFGTPRERINVVGKEGKLRIITDETNVDVTLRLEEEIERFLEKNPVFDRIVLKSKSPSCGYKTTPILNELKEQISLGNGIASTIIAKKFQEIVLESELDFI